jgi:hypothetical protein
MEVVENRDQWQASYEGAWLANYQETGEFDWSLYPRPRNRRAPPGPGVRPHSGTPLSPLRLLGVVGVAPVPAYCGLTQCQSAYARMT